MSFGYNNRKRRLILTIAKRRTCYGFNMYISTKILFGSGRLKELNAQEMPGTKAMIVISKGKSTRANGYLERTEEQLHLAGVETVVFDRIEANPLKETVMAGAAYARERDVDFIVALGGGSCMDAAKAIATMATNKGDCWDYMSRGTGKRLPIERMLLPIIAITTTVDWLRGGLLGRNQQRRNPRKDGIRGD